MWLRSAGMILERSMKQSKKRKRYMKNLRSLSRTIFQARACTRLKGIISGMANLQIKKKPRWHFTNCEHLVARFEASINKFKYMKENIFETIKKLDNNGKEYWSSRELSEILEYADYRKFLGVIEKAKIACENSGEVIHNHFVHTDEMVPIGSGAERPVDTIYLSRYACYLIVQNSDPTKVVVAKGQTYFAIQTRRQERTDNLIEDRSRVFLRGDIKKKLKKSQKILDHMHSEELAANLFRATQTDAKIKRENIKGQGRANLAHYEVGQKVRNTIVSLGGTMPEELPTPDAIGKAQMRINRSEKIKKIENGKGKK